MSHSLDRTKRLGVQTVAILALSVFGLGAYAWMHRRPTGSLSDLGVTAVSVTDTGCEPVALEVSAGKVTFLIANNSKRVVEWEILDGVMVLDERENIAPGLSQRLTTRLDPGVYAITCGLLSNPRGRLTVKPLENDGQKQRPPELVALVAPMAEYKVFVTMTAIDVADAADRVAEAMRQGDRGAAEAALSEAHVGYERIRPAIKLLFADLDVALDASQSDYAKGLDDPSFTGFRRLAAGLAAGQALDAMASIADRLALDVVTLRDRLADTMIPPVRMITGASMLLSAAAFQDGKQQDGTAVTLANIDGAEKVVALLRPLTRKVDLVASDRLDASVAAARESVVSGKQKSALQALAEEIASLRKTLGLDG
jgi:iron uptake system component EfeO